MDHTVTLQDPELTTRDLCTLAREALQPGAPEALPPEMLPKVTALAEAYRDMRSHARMHGVTPGHLPRRTLCGGMPEVKARERFRKSRPLYDVVWEGTTYRCAIDGRGLFCTVSRGDSCDRFAPDELESWTRVVKRERFEPHEDRIPCEECGNTGFTSKWTDDEPEEWISGGDCEACDGQGYTIELTEVVIGW